MKFDGLKNCQENAKDERLSFQDGQEIDNENNNNQERKITKEKNNLKVQKRKKFLKKKRQKKRARIVIRNLSFKVCIKIRCMIYTHYNTNINIRSQRVYS